MPREEPRGTFCRLKPYVRLIYTAVFSFSLLCIVREYELEGEGQRRKRGDRNDDAASAGGKRRQRGDEDDEQRGEQTASGAREGDHAGENRRDEGKETRPARKRRQTTRYVAGPATGSAGKQREQDQEHGDEREGARRSADKQQRRRRK